MSHTEIKRISIDEVIESGPQAPIIDVRTPKEFEKGHIPGALNLPIFSNEERVKIGTTYKRIGREAAILMGLNFTGPKWSGFIKEALNVAPQKEVIVHCWRGGMRSEAMAWVLSFYGFKVSVIDGGYKSFRRWVLSRFEDDFDFLVLGGMTGSHKTDILLELEKMGEQIVDLEGLANHHGSAYGSMNDEGQPSQEMFENKLAHHLHDLNLRQRIWIEDESTRIGEVRVPAALWRQMQNTDVIELRVNTEERVQYLVEEYGSLEPEFLIDSTLKISKRLGLERTNEAISAIREKRMKDFIENVLIYYDKAYKNCLARRKPEHLFPLSLRCDDIRQSALETLNYSKVLAETA